MPMVSDLFIHMKFGQSLIPQVVSTPLLYVNVLVTCCHEIRLLKMNADLSVGIQPFIKLLSYTCAQLYLAKLLIGLAIDSAIPVLGLCPADIVAKI